MHAEKMLFTRQNMERIDEKKKQSINKDTNIYFVQQNASIINSEKSITSPPLTKW